MDADAAAHVTSNGSRDTLVVIGGATAALVGGRAVVIWRRCHNARQWLIWATHSDYLAKFNETYLNRVHLLKKSMFKFNGYKAEYEKCFIDDHLVLSLHMYIADIMAVSW